MSVAVLAAFAQLAISVSAPDTVALAETAELRVRVIVPSPNLPKLTVPSFAPFVLLRSDASQRLSSSPGSRIEGVVDYRYVLSPTRAGRFRIPPFEAAIGRSAVRSRPITVVVRRDAARDSIPAVVSRAVLDSAQQINFRALVLPDTVYVGQQATYQLGVFLGRDVRDRLRKMEAVAPEMRGMLMYDPVLPMSVFPVVGQGGRELEAHVYQRAVFPLTSGRLLIPPARLVYSVPVSTNFFSREESIELLSDSIVVVAVEPPLPSRPADYSGAVGRLRVEARLDDASLRVGVPVSLRVSVSGVANVKLLPRPEVSISWANVVPADERVHLVEDAVVVRGTKEFEWVLTPTRAGRLELPAIQYRYFDPGSQQYELAATRPRPVFIAPGTLAQLDSVGSSRTQRLALRTTYRGALAPPVYVRPPFWIALALAPVPAGVLLAMRRARPARRRPRGARRLLALARAGEGRSSVREIRRAFLVALAERIGARPAALTARGGLERVARRAGVTAETAAAAEALLAELDAAAFGRDPLPLPAAAERAYEVFRCISREARSAPVRMARIAPLAVVVLSYSIVAFAAPRTADDARLFARGVAAYEAGRYGQAAATFRSVAGRLPRAADAWANAGTAAWASADTANAVFGWQRALRLEPLAGDARERLSLVASGDGHAAGTVPQIPPTPIAIAAAALWLVAWALVAYRIGRRVRVGGMSLAAGLGVAAIAFGVAVFAIDRRLAAQDLAIVGRTSWLREIPALGSQRIDRLHCGEVARILERRAEWSRVASGANEGWVETAAVLSLARE